MRTTSPVMALVVAAGLVASCGGCSSDDTDPPSPTGIDVTVGVTVGGTVPGTEAAVPVDSAPSTGVGAINGPASVDTSYMGANPGGDDSGG